MSKNPLQFSLKDPLHALDTENTTYGCRANNSDICKNCYVENICAFSSSDCICKAPSAKWKKYFVLLKEQSHED